MQNLVALCPHSKLIRYPQLLSLWGDPFSADFSEERSRYYLAIDQIKIKINNKES